VLATTALLAGCGTSSVPRPAEPSGTTQSEQAGVAAPAEISYRDNVIVYAVVAP
jgi:hypothetical protein